MKGIIVAGGLGTRLYPITLGISKQLMPIYDKPMIYYPLSTLMKAGINEILIITRPDHVNFFKNLLGDGLQLGCKFEYKVEYEQKGVANAYVISEKFIGNDSVAMILGDNIFYGSDLDELLNSANKISDGAMIFAYHVSDPERYGVVEFDENMNVLSLEEKPDKPKSNYAQAGLYFSDNSIVEIAKNLKFSTRGELEVTDAMAIYLKQNKLRALLMETGMTWLDTGTFQSMMQASQFVQVIEERQGIKIGCIEEEAYRQGFINKKQLQKLAKPFIKSGYGRYLLHVSNSLP